MIKQVSFIIVSDQYGMVRRVRRTTNERYDRMLETICWAIREGDKIYGVRSIDADFDTLAFMKRPSDMGIENGCLCRLNENSARATGVSASDPMGFGVLDFIAEMKPNGYYVRGQLGRVQDYQGRPNKIAMPGDDYEIQDSGQYVEDPVMLENVANIPRHNVAGVKAQRRSDRAQGREVLEVRHGNLNLIRTPLCSLAGLSERVTALRDEDKTNEEIATILGCKWDDT